MHHQSRAGRRLPRVPLLILAALATAPSDAAGPTVLAPPRPSATTAIEVKGLGEVEVRLAPVSVVTDRTRFVVGRDRPHAWDRSRVRTRRGKVEGSADSRMFLVETAEGRIGYLDLDGARHWISTRERIADPSSKRGLPPNTPLCGCGADHRPGAMPLFLPKSLFSMAAGAIFGPFWGLLWVLAGCGLAASLVFLLANRGLRDAVSRRLADHPKLAAIDAAVAARGPRLVLLLRATPVSFAGMNWVLSASGVSWRSYSIGLLGLVPGTLAAVAIGYAARHTADLASRTAAEGSLAPGDSILREIGLYASVAASVLVTVVVTRIAVRAVHEATGAA